MAGYDDVETLLTGWFPTVLSGVRAVTELPADLAGNVPLLRITVLGGDEPVPTLDRVTVDLEAFHATRAEASALAGDARRLLRFMLPGHVTSTGSVVAKVATSARPAWRPYDDVAVRRVGALYQLTVHTPGA
jgi:hypothetical protein